jgi:hypothetical protein
MQQLDADEMNAHHSRRTFARHLLATSALAAVGLSALPADAAGNKLTIFKSPSCGCCQAWADHMQHSGFNVEIVQAEDLSPIKVRFGVPRILEACHTATGDNYVIEGHVPAGDVKRLLRERPKANGLAVAGMPIGSPGMEQGKQREPFKTILFGKTGYYFFGTHT